jgi:hypothetical protein
VAVLAQFKSSGAQQEGQSRMQEQLLHGEVAELQKRCVKISQLSAPAQIEIETSPLFPLCIFRLRKAEERCRALETDKDAILASTHAVSPTHYTLISFKALMVCNCVPFPNFPFPPFP